MLDHAVSQTVVAVARFHLPDFSQAPLLASSTLKPHKEQESRKHTAGLRIEQSYGFSFYIFKINLSNVTSLIFPVKAASPTLGP